MPKLSAENVKTTNNKTGGCPVCGETQHKRFACAAPNCTAAGTQCESTTHDALCQARWTCNYHAFGGDWHNDGAEHEPNRHPAWEAMTPEQKQIVRSLALDTKTLDVLPVKYRGESYDHFVHLCGEFERQAELGPVAYRAEAVKRIGKLAKRIGR